MRILVTGGAGYIGSHCVSELLKAGHHVAVVDNLSTGFRAAISSDADVPFFQEDIRQISSIKNILLQEKIEAVVHLAAKLIVPDSISHPLDYYENNVFGTLQLLKACQETGVNRFVFSSTATVYGDGQLQALKEDDAVRTINPYGSSKRMVEQILQDYSLSNKKFKFIVLRYFNAAGAAVDGSNGQRNIGATHLIKVASEVAVGKRSQLQIFGTDWPTPDGTGLRDYVHVQDLAAAHVAALQALENNHAGGIFNCGYGKGISVREVIQAFSKVVGKKLNTIEVARRAGDAVSLIADSSRLRHELAWVPRYDDLELICKTAYEWEKKTNE